MRAHALEALRVLGELGHELLLDLDVGREVLDGLLHLELRRLEGDLRLARLLLLDADVLLLEAHRGVILLLPYAALTPQGRRRRRPARAAAVNRSFEQGLLQLGDAQQVALEQSAQRLLGRLGEGGRRDRHLLARRAVLRLQQQQLDARHLGRVALAQPRNLRRAPRRLLPRRLELRGKLRLARRRRRARG